MLTRAVLTSLMFASCIALGGEEPTPSHSLKILSWNVHHGVGLEGKHDLPRIASFIRDQQVDVVALQEIDNHCDRSGKIDQVAELSSLTGLSGAFGAAMPFQGGHYGLAILSRHPIENTRVVKLPGKGEPRVAFVASLRTPAGPVTFVSTHFGLEKDTRAEQANELIEALRDITGPVIVAGDFNAVPGSPEMKLLEKAWTFVKKKGLPETSPADRPGTEIDHFFVRGATPAGDAEVLAETTSSDHRPIAARVLIAKP